MPSQMHCLGPADLIVPTVCVSLNWKWPVHSPVVVIDASAFLLNVKSMVYHECAMVFYDRPIDYSCAVCQHTPSSFDQDHFQVTFPLVPDAVERLVFCLTLEATAATPTFNAMASINTQVIHPATREVLADVHSQSTLGTESGLIVAELYRHRDGWKFRAVGQGFAGRLAALATHFGVVNGAEHGLHAEVISASVGAVQQDAGCFQSPR